MERSNIFLMCSWKIEKEKQVEKTPIEKYVGVIVHLLPGPPFSPVPTKGQDWKVPEVQVQII